MRGADGPLKIKNLETFVKYHSISVASSGSHGRRMTHSVVLQVDVKLTGSGYSPLQSDRCMHSTVQR